MVCNPIRWGVGGYGQGLSLVTKLCKIGEVEYTEPIVLAVLQNQDFSENFVKTLT